MEELQEIMMDSKEEVLQLKMEKKDELEVHKILIHEEKEEPLLEVQMIKTL